VTSKLQLAPGDFPVDQWWTKDSVRVTYDQINQARASLEQPG